MGDDYELFEQARLADWQSRHVTDFERVYALFEVFKDYAGAGLDFQDARYATPDELRGRIEFHKWLSKDRLSGFYDVKGIKLFKVGNQELEIGSAIMPECSHGMEFRLSDGDKTTIYVGGSLDAGRTDVDTIQGARNCDYSDFKEIYGIHPANLTLLLYLKLGELVGHEEVRIIGPSRCDRTCDTTPAFYNIPRNYFRLRTNSETGNFQFDGSKRDSILRKFAGKNETVSSTFNQLEAYVSSLKSNSQ